MQNSPSPESLLSRLHRSPHGQLHTRLGAYARPLAALSRVKAPRAMWRVLPASTRSWETAPSLERGATIAFATVYGSLTVSLDVSHFPALESIAHDADVGRRIALANLYLEPWLAPLRDNCIDGLAVASLTLLEREGAGKDATEDAAARTRSSAGNGLPIALGKAGLPCVVEDIAAALVEAIARAADKDDDSDQDRTHQDRTPAATTVTATRYANVLRALPLSGGVRIASRAFRIDTLASLRPGDVLLGWPRRTPYRPGAPFDDLTVRWGAASGTQFQAHADVDGFRIFLKGPFTMTHDALDYPTDHPADSLTDSLTDSPTAYTPDHAGDGSNPSADVASDINDADAFVGPPAPALPPRVLDAMTLPVHIEVATLALPLSALAAMHPGYLLELPVPLEDAPIRLVSCGRTIGTGQLVAVGDNLGVRITDLATGNER